MHELSIVSRMLEQVDREIRNHRGARVRRVKVRIGAASGVEAELFEHAFVQLRSGACETAELEVNRVPSCWRCSACQREFGSGDALFCECCGLPCVLVSGAELMLDRIELELSHV
ncbi:MAG TPA: hydrogenase maturation nickel metallochaperone HypA [Polyangiaceae bacterium]|nr:hydrogenase maturation nickel metallochaperone HypA [Polyangiaceae bacterium]